MYWSRVTNKGSTMATVIRFSVQLGLVAVLMAGLTLATDYANFRSPWNLVWMLVPPFIIARLFDQGEGVWPLTGLYLLVGGFMAMVGTAALFGLGT